jgi:general secretion pathway protein E
MGADARHERPGQALDNGLEPASLLNNGGADAASLSLHRVSFATLAAGKPLLEGLSVRYLREVGAYVYQDGLGNAKAALASEELVPFVETIEWTLQRPVAAELANREDILAALEKLDSHLTTSRTHGAGAQSGLDNDDDTIEALRDLASGAPVVRAVSEIIELATERRATDIHLEPADGMFRVRIRVDGMLTPLRTYSPELARPIVSRVKILASLNIAERRLPQDGRTRINVGGAELDIRVATMPTIYGEAAILRLLRRDKHLQRFDQLGLHKRDFGVFKGALKAPHGLIVVCGPTGSGKTTTLAAALTVLNDGSRKILTVEDPVEYEIDGVHQTQVKPAIGLTFANALRSFLRLDPDVIMVGEMRDGETARVGIQASLTGHLVLTTLHTNTAAAAITRLVDLEIESFLLSASLQCIVAQRLVRKLCLHCRKSVRADEALLADHPRYRALGVEGQTVWEAGHCDRCAGTGYAGRRSVFEVLQVTDELRHIITRRGSEAEIETAAKRNGMATLIEDGVRTALAGETSLAEVLRVTASR